MNARALAAAVLILSANAAFAHESSSAHYSNVSWAGGATVAPAAASAPPAPAASAAAVRPAKTTPRALPPAAIAPAAAAEAAPLWPWAALGSALIFAGTLVVRSRARTREKAADDTLALAAHELKSPLSAIESYLDLMASEAPEDARTTRRWLEDVGHMKSTAAHLRRTIGDILDMTRIEDGRMKVAPRRQDVKPILAEVAAAYAAGARARGVRVTVEAGADLPEANVDPDRLRQVLHNLLGNALKFTPSGKNVFLAARCEGSRLLVEVRDEGVGVPPGKRALLFGKFARLAPALDGTEGTGLGLYISRRLVEAQGGRLSYAPGPGGRGSVLTVTLPREAGA